MFQLGSDVLQFGARLIDGDTRFEPSNREEIQESTVVVHLFQNTGENLPWGEGDAPIREVLRLVKQEAWPIRGYIEYDYAGPTGAIDEVKKCLAYASEALM